MNISGMMKLGAVFGLFSGTLCGFGAMEDWPYVNGEIIVQMTPGSTTQQAQALASGHGLVIVKVMTTPGMYLLSLPNPSVPNHRQLSEEKVTRLRANPLVREALLNYIAELYQFPNDPEFGPGTSQQWNLFQIGLPGPSGAWATHLGLPGVNVANIDTLVDYTHSDFRTAGTQPRLLTPFDPDGGGIPPLPAPGFDHGTMTSSVIVAGTNNGLDMAGVTWEGVRLRLFAAKNLSFARLFECYQRVIDDNRAPGAIPYIALNMSYGSGAPNRIELQYLNHIASQGTIPVAASGNSRPWPAGWPASFPSVISVAATRFASWTKGIPTSYSSPGSTDGTRKVDIAAPSADFTAGVLCLMAGGGVTTGGGTSYACPTVVGAIALLYSGGMARQDIIPALKQTGVVAPGATKPNLDTGFGEIDVAAAMALITPYVKPEVPAIDNFESPYQTAEFRFRMFRVRETGPAPTVTVRKQDLSFSYVLSPSEYTITTDPLDSRVKYMAGRARLSDGTLDPGDWEIIVEGTEMAPGSSVITGSRLIRVVYNVIPAGTSMVSTPYGVGGTGSPPGGRTPDSVFPSATIFRWVPTGGGSYAQYLSGQPNTSGAGFTPLDMEVIRATQPGPVLIETPQSGPFGVGLWINSPSDSVMDFEQGPEEGVIWYRIKLRVGWNQIGSPFPYNVDWGTCSIVRIPTLQQHTVIQAANLGIIKPQLFRYELGLGGLKSYTWASPPNGQLIAWESHWVFANEECWLQVPPIPGTTRGRGPEVVRGEGWLTQLRISSGGTSDSGNFFFGMTRNLNESFDLVSKPPTTPGAVSGWFVSANGQSRYAQDLRELAPTREEWRLIVRPNAPNTDVTITWSEVVRPVQRLRLTLRDVANGRVITMQPNGSYTFRADEAMTPREFRLTSQHDAVGRLVVSGVRVSGGSRSGGSFTVQYNLSSDAEVQIRILGANGRPIANLESRSRSAGQNVVVWNGRNLDGVSVAPGVYMVEITAETASGERVRTTSPITVTR